MTEQTETAVKDVEGGGEQDPAAEVMDVVQKRLFELADGLEELGLVGDGETFVTDRALTVIQEQHAEIAELKAKLEAAEAAAKKAKADVKVAKADQGPKARLCTAATRDEVAPLASEDDRRSSAARLLELIRSADSVEILFCRRHKKGGEEIMGLAPVTVEGAAWVERPLGVMLTAPVDLVGPQPGTPPFVVEGFGLMLDGKPVLYAPRVNGQLTIGNGQTVRVADDIIF